MNYKKIMVAGGGVLGSQIAFQSAYCGFDVTIYLNEERFIKDTKDKIDKLKENYKKALEDMKNDNGWSSGIADAGKKINEKDILSKIENAYKSIKFETNIEKAVKDIDLVIESIPEDYEIKKCFYLDLRNYLEDKTVVVTNSSSMLPSTFAKYTGREEKYLALHFANSIWKNNTAEVMGHDNTDKNVFNDVVSFANAIRMIALPIYKEKAGYLLNSMLIPFLLSSLDMYASGISDPVTIDTAWTRGTGAIKGPFAIMDIVGLNTTLNIVNQYQKVPGLLSPLLKKMLMPYNFKKMKKLLEEYIKDGKVGKSSKEGFYKYDKEGNIISK